MGYTIGTLLTALINTEILKKVNNGMDKFKENKDIKLFLNEIEKWYNDFISKKESTVVSGSNFYFYIKNYNLVKNLISFIREPQIGQKEDQFLKSKKDEVINYVNERKTLTLDDECAINDFIDGLFNLIKQYFISKIPPQNQAQNYLLMQCLSESKVIGNKLGETNQNIATILQKSIPSQKSYQMPANMITRRIALYKDLQESFNFATQHEDMLEACIKEKHIVLLGEAGSGKSVALIQLAAMVSQTEYYPLLYNLNNYTDSTINQIIQDEYPGLETEPLFLIFDAFDEIEDTNKMGFAKKLCDFISGNPDVIVLISTRNNFYSFSDDTGNGGLFEYFKEYGISRITKSDIMEFVKYNEIDYDKFMTEANKNELYEIINNPFYLKELIAIYKANGELPIKSNLMDKIIQNRFKADVNKYVRTKNLEDYEVNIFDTLEELSFAIQVMHTVKISNVDYQKIFKNADDRAIIKYSGIFNKDASGNWSFEHNNFREYLAAKYINRLNITEIKKLICNEDGYPFESWINVLSFLILIREDRDLLQLLEEKSPGMIVRFEKSRIEEEKRSEIGQEILSSLADKNMWLSHSLNNSHSIADFCQSKGFCEYLLEQIVHPQHFRSLSNALSVLSEFNNLFGLNNIIRDVLLHCLKSTAVRDYEKSKTMDTIVKLKLNDDKITEFIVDSYKHDCSEEYKLGVVKYLNSIDCYEEHIDLFIEKYNHPSKESDDYLDIHHEILDAFVKVHNVENICKVIKAIAKHNSFSIEKDAYDKVIRNAIELYNAGSDKILTAISDVLVEAEMKNYEFFNACITFLNETNTKVLVFMKLVNLNLDIKSFNKTIFVLERFADSSCYDFLLEQFSKNKYKYKDIVVEFANQFNVDDPMYNKFKMELQHNGITLPERKPYFDHEKAWKLGQQNHFDLLFNKEKYCDLVKKMVTNIGDINITFSKLKEIEYQPINYEDTTNIIEEHTLLHLYYAILTDENDNRIVYDTIYGTNWEYFILIQTYNILLKNKSVIVSDNQKDFYRSYCNQQLKEINFRTDVRNNTDGGITYTYRSMFFIFFSDYFDFEYDKSIFKNMLFISPYLFVIYDKLGCDEIPPYIRRHLCLDEIRQQIQSNLKEDNLCNDTIDMYIEFCKNNKLDYGIDASIKICETVDYESWEKRKALEYLDEVMGYGYIYDRFIGSNDSNLIDAIAAITLKYKDLRLRERLEKLNKDSGDGKRYITQLILLNSRYGLEKYYDIVHSNMMPLNISDNSVADSTVEAISAITDITLIDVLEKFRMLLFADGFIDEKYFGLNNNLYKAYKNLSYKNYEVVKTDIQNALCSSVMTNAEKAFCNSLLADIEYLHNHRTDIPWSIDEIIKFFRCQTN